LDHGYRAPTTVRDATVARTRAQAPEHGPDEHGDDPAAHVVIPRQLVPHAVREAQNPLPNGHVGEHVIEQVGGALGHPAPAATRTEGAPFTRKRDQPIEAAVATAKSREPAGKPATLQKVPELLLDEAGQAFPIAQADRLRAKGLEVIVHDLIKRTLRGTPRFVPRRGRGHSRPAGGRGANEEADDFVLNARACERPVADIAVECVSRDRGSCATWNDGSPYPWAHLRNVFLEKRIAEKNARDPRRTDFIRSPIAAFPCAAHNPLTNHQKRSVRAARAHSPTGGGSDVWRLRSTMG
jgi:hypothetical protein